MSSGENLFKFDVEVIFEAIKKVNEASVNLLYRDQAALSLLSFTTSPALGSVAGQYLGFLGTHPGSLAVATQSVLGNIDFLHTSLSQFAEALQQQESASASALSAGRGLNGTDSARTVMSMPPRQSVPVSDLGYLPPSVIVEAGAPVEALVSMFTGGDGVIIAAAQTWQAAATRLSAAADALESAETWLAGANSGAAFDAACAVIADTAGQARVIAANAVTMGESMGQLPGVRAGALARVLAINEELQVARTAVVASGVANPAGVAAGMAGLEARERAEVAGFVSGFLQPALDTVRPVVSNLGDEVVGHSGGGQLVAAATSVSGWDAAASSVSPITQVSQAAPSVGQIPGGAGSGQVTGSGVVEQAVGASAQGTGTGVSATPQLTGMRGAPTAVSTGGLGGLGGPGVKDWGAGVGTDSAGRRGVDDVNGRAADRLSRRGQGSVAQPLLPRAASGGPGSGGGFLSGSGGPGSAGTSPAPLGQHAPIGATGSVQGQGGGPGALSRTVPVSSGGTPVSAGPAGVPAASGARGSQGSRPAASAASVFKGGRGRGRDVVREFFRRQFLGAEPQTVKTVLR